MLRFRLPVPRFLSSGEVFLGKGSLGVLRALDAARAAIVVDPWILEDDQVRGRLEKILRTIDVRFIAVDPGEPTIDAVRKLTAAVAACRPDWIVAIGGGSAIDGGRLAWTFYEHPDADLNRISRPFSLPPLRGKARFAAIPTTAGTGAEVSSAAVLIDPAGGQKLQIVSHELLPDLAILDPSLLVSLPARIAAMSGMDALAHLLESYVSRFENPLADMQAVCAVSTLFRLLFQSIEAPEDLETRIEIMTAATIGGWLQNLKIPGVGHAIAHQMARFHIPHGLACGILLAPAIRFNCQKPEVRKKYDRLAEKIQIGDADELAIACEDLRQKINLQGMLGDQIIYGKKILLSQRESIAKTALKDICARANPTPLDEEKIGLVLEQAV